MQRYLASLPKGVPPWGYAALAVFAIAWPHGVANFWVFLGAAACLFAIAALGLTVLVGWAGEVSLAHAGVVGAAVYISGYAVRADGWAWPYWAAIPVGILVGVLLYVLVSLPTSRMSGIYVMILTLGLQVTIERSIFTYPSLTGGPDAVAVDRPVIFGISLDADLGYYYLVAAVLALVLILLTLFRTTRHGRAMLLVKTDRRAAEAVGIAPYRYKVLAFAMAGALAGLAGALTPGLYRSPPTLLQYLAIPALLYLAVPVTAGFESLMAVVVVAFAFQMIPQALEGLHLSPFVVGGVALLAGTYVGSRGLGGVALDYLRRFQRDVPTPGLAVAGGDGANGNGRTPHPRTPGQLGEFQPAEATTTTPHEGTNGNGGTAGSAPFVALPPRPQSGERDRRRASSRRPGDRRPGGQDDDAPIRLRPR